MRNSLLDSLAESFASKILSGIQEKILEQMQEERQSLSSSGRGEQESVAMGGENALFLTPNLAAAFEEKGGDRRTEQAEMGVPEAEKATDRDRDGDAGWGPDWNDVGRLKGAASDSNFRFKLEGISEGVEKPISNPNESISPTGDEALGLEFASSIRYAAASTPTKDGSKKSNSTASASSLNSSGADGHLIPPGFDHGPFPSSDSSYFLDGNSGSFISENSFNSILKNAQDNSTDFDFAFPRRPPGLSSPPVRARDNDVRKTDETPKMSTYGSEEPFFFNSEKCFNNPGKWTGIDDNLSHTGSTNFSREFENAFVEAPPNDVSSVLLDNKVLDNDLSFLDSTSGSAESGFPSSNGFQSSTGSRMWDPTGCIKARGGSSYDTESSNEEDTSPRLPNSTHVFGQMYKNRGDASFKPYNGFTAPSASTSGATRHWDSNRGLSCSSYENDSSSNEQQRSPRASSKPELNYAQIFKSFGELIEKNYAEAVKFAPWIQNILVEFQAREPQAVSSPGHNTSYDLHQQEATNGEMVKYQRQPTAPLWNNESWDQEGPPTPGRYGDLYGSRVKCHRDIASYAEKSQQACIWSGELPPRVHRNPVYSCKIFLGGVPYDITEAGLIQAFRPFGNVKIEWPGKDKDANTPKGFLYVIFEHETQVKMLLQNCSLDYRRNRKTCDYYFKLSSKRYREKEVQVIPWAMSDSTCVRCPTARLESRRTVFVGALHGMLNAEGLAHIMDSLFGGVIYAAIDTEKYKYPIGSGRVFFNNTRSYMKAVSAAFVEIKSKFNKVIQIDPYLEDSPCSACNLQLGPYFCREFCCFQYFCYTCFVNRHNTEEYQKHRPVMRNTKKPKEGFGAVTSVSFPNMSNNRWNISSSNSNTNNTFNNNSKI